MNARSKIDGEKSPASGTDGGTRYIVDDLIHKVSGQEKFEQITVLNLTLVKDGGKIKYIENLDRLQKLEVLNLSHNAIQKIEKLDKLTRLRELNLSFNCIAKIEHLESLTCLQVLNLTGNQIESIPAWFPKKLRALRVFKIAKNQIQSLQELIKLRPLNNISELVAADNPVSQLSHYRLFLIFHLRTLQILDGKTIDFQERQLADGRFSQEELAKLMEKLESKQTDFDNLMVEHNKLLQDMEEKNRKQLSLEETTKQMQNKLNQAIHELETKNDMLRKKTAEVTKACEKHYALEQELAFYKIDHKFDALSRPPNLPTPDASLLSDGDDLAPGESPYIGRGRFRPNEHAIETKEVVRPVVIQHGSLSSERAVLSSSVPMAAGMKASHGSMSAASDVYQKLLPSTESVNQEMLEMKSRIEEDLKKKLQATELVEARLQKRCTELKLVEERIASAVAELSKIDERQNAEQTRKHQVAERLSRLHQTQDEAKQLEQKLIAVERDIDNKDRVLSSCHQQLKQTNPNDPAYNNIRGKIAEIEYQLGASSKQHQMLESQLQAKLTAVAEETEKLQLVEKEARGSVNNAEVQQELETAVTSLSAYMTTAQEKFDRQNQQISMLLNEKAQLSQKMRDFETQADTVRQQAAEISYLREHIGGLEESIRDVVDSNQSLQTQLEAAKVKDGTDGQQVLDSRLETAENQLREMREAMKKVKQQAEVEKEKYEQLLQAEAKKLNQLKHRIRDVDNKELEIRDLHNQLSEIQNANSHLQDQLYAFQQQRHQQKQSAIDADALKRRLDEVTAALQSYRASGGKRMNHVQSVQTEDPVEDAINNLQNSVQTELTRTAHDLNRAVRSNQKLEQKVASLQDEIIQVQEQERAMAERAIQSVYDTERQEADILRDEIGRLQNELQKMSLAANRKQNVVLRDHHQTGRSVEDGSKGSSTQSQTTSVSRSASDASSVSSSSASQWSARRRELINSMTDEERELFDELQDEISQLRKLLAAQDSAAAPKLEDAKRKNQMLKTLINKRQPASNSPQADSFDDMSPRSSDDGQHQEVERPEPRRPSHHGGRDARANPSFYRQHTRRPIGERQDTVIDHLQSVVSDQADEIERLQTALQQIANDSGHGYDDEDDAVSHQDISGDSRRLRRSQRLSSGARQSDKSGRSRNQRQHAAGPYSPTSGLSNSSPGPEFHPDGGGGDGYSYPIQHYPYNLHGVQQPVEVISSLPTVPSYPQPYPNGMPINSLPAQHVPGFPAPQSAGYLVQQPPPLNVPFPAPHVAGATVPFYPLPALNPSNPQPSINVPTAITNAGIPTPWTGAIQPSLPINQVQVQPVATVVSSQPQSEHSSAVADGHAFVCNIAEHHDLEDYVAELREKNRLLKERSRMKIDSKQRRVSFGSTKYRHANNQAVRQLQNELNERQAELEALDLAVEQQKQICRRLSLEESELLMQLRRTRSVGNLEGLGLAAYDHAALSSGRRRSLVERESERNLLADELHHLELTLASRQDELRRIDQLILEQQTRLDDINTETLIARTSHSDVVRETTELEQRTSDAETASLRLAAEIAQLQDELDILNNDKAQLRQTLIDIEDIIGAKDAEFREIVSKIETATQMLSEIQSQVDVSSELVNWKQSVSQMQDEVAKRCDELDSVRQQITSERQALEQVQSELASGQQDLQMMVEAINKRHAILETLDVQLDTEITRRRHDIEEAVRDIERLLKEKHSIEDEMRLEKNRVEQTRSDIQKNEELLHRLKAESTESHAELREVEKQLSVRRNELSELDARANERRAEVDRITGDYERAMQQLDAARAENRKKSTDLEKMSSQLAREKRSLEHAAEQRKHLELSIQNLQADKDELEASHRELNDKIAELLRERTAAESLVRNQQQVLDQVNAECSRVETRIEENQSKETALNDELTKLNTQINTRQSQLDGINADIGSCHTNLKALLEEQQLFIRQRDDLNAHMEQLNSRTVEMKHVLHSLTVEVGEANVQLASSKTQLNDLRAAIAERTSALSNCEIEIEVLKREAERLQLNKSKFMSLEARVKNIGDELDRKMRENNQLTIALRNFKQELQQRTEAMAQESMNLQEQLKVSAIKNTRTENELKIKSEELKQTKEMWSSERTRLELSVQSHLARANRLADEMAYLRSVNLELQRRLDTQEQIGERETNLVQALNSLKSNLKHEVTENVFKTERSRQLSSELTELQSNNDSLRQCVDEFRQNLSALQDYSSDIPLIVPSAATCNGSTKDFFADHQEMLKMQLRQKMQRHADAVNTQKRLSQNTINNLRSKLTNLEQVLSQTDAAKLAQMEAAAKRRTSDELNDGNAASARDSREGATMNDAD